MCYGALLEKAHSELPSGKEESSVSPTGLNEDVSPNELGTQIDDVALKRPGGQKAKRTDGHVFPAHRRMKMMKRCKKKMKK